MFINGEKKAHRSKTDSSRSESERYFYFVEYNSYIMLLRLSLVVYNYEHDRFVRDYMPLRIAISIKKKKFCFSALRNNANSQGM